MILENGVIRTLDPSLPESRALAIAGDRIAGGVGVHETALASPETIDLGGRCVLPGFTDSHVHFPTWAIAQHEVKLDGCTSLDEALARIRVRGGARHLAARLRLARRRLDGRPLPHARRPRRDHRRPARRDDLEGLPLVWLNSAGLAFAGGDLDVEGGVVERDAGGEPTGILREEAAWRFKERYMHVPADDYVTAMRTGVKLANARGVTCVHDKDGWLGAAGLWQRLDEQRALTLRVWQSVPYERLPELRALSLRSGVGSPLLRLGYLKVFMDGTLGSQTAWMLDGSGVQITSGDHLAEIVTEARRPAGPSACTRSATARTARRSMRSSARARLAARRAPAAHRACTVPRAGGRRPLRRARRRDLGAVQPRALRPRSRRALLGRQARRHVFVPLARSTRARSSRTARTRRSRSSTPGGASSPASGARSTTGRRGARRRR